MTFESLSQESSLSSDTHTSSTLLHVPGGGGRRGERWGGCAEGRGGVGKGGDGWRQRLEVIELAYLRSPVVQEAVIKFQVRGRGRGREIEIVFFLGGGGERDNELFSHVSVMSCGVETHIYFV